MLPARIALLAVLVLAGISAAPAHAEAADDPMARAAAVCADHPNQASAQRAKDTRDADGDGIYCEALPCPCAGAGGGGATRPAGPSPAAKRRAAAIKRRAAARRRAAAKRRAAARRRASERRRLKELRARYEGGTGNVVAVTDGDTIRVQLPGEQVRVRILGVDASEMGACGATEGTRNMEALAPVGSTVTLDTDETQDVRDAYGRVLAYVTNAGGADVGLEQVRAGWAETYEFARRVRRAGAYFDAEAGAEVAGAGVWSACAPAGTAATAYTACGDGGDALSVHARRVDCESAMLLADRFAEGDLDRAAPPIVFGFRCRTKAAGAGVAQALCTLRDGLQVVRFNVSA